MSESRLTVQLVPIQRLDADKFRPFGAVIDEQALAFPEFDSGEGRMAFEMFSMKRSKLTREVMGFHFSYTQPVVTLRGKLGLMVAPPPADHKTKLESAEIDYNNVAAFELHSGQGVIIGRGVWHDFVSLSDACTVLHLTRRLTNERFSTPAESVNMRQRDHRVVQLEPLPQHGSSD
jgi:ureidoglycolate hydrolase